MNTTNQPSVGAATARFYFGQISRRHPQWLLAHAIVLLHFFLNYQLGLLFAWWLLAMLTLSSVNIVPVHLPVPRRRLFNLSLLPALVVGLVCLVVAVSQTQSRGIGTGTELNWRSSPVTFVSQSDGAGQERRLSVPAHLWRLSWGTPPASPLPSGEIQPESFQVLGPIHAYNPYTASMSDGPDVAGYQFSRALEACCDLRLSPEQAAAHIRYEGNGGLDTVYESARRIQTTPVALVALEFWVTAAVLFLTLRALMAADNGRSRLKAVLRVGAVLLITAMYMAVVAGSTHSTLVSSDVWWPLLTLRAALAQAASIGAAVPWIGAALGLAVLVMLYHRASAQYERLELPRSPSR